MHLFALPTTSNITQGQNTSINHIWGSFKLFKSDSLRNMTSRKEESSFQALMAGILHGNVIATANSSLGGKISGKN